MIVFILGFRVCLLPRILYILVLDSLVPLRIRFATRGFETAAASCKDEACSSRKLPSRTFLGSGLFCPRLRHPGRDVSLRRSTRTAVSSERKSLAEPEDGDWQYEDEVNEGESDRGYNAGEQSRQHKQRRQRLRRQNADKTMRSKSQAVADYAVGYPVHITHHLYGKRRGKQKEDLSSSTVVVTHALTDDGDSTLITQARGIACLHVRLQGNRHCKQYVQISEIWVRGEFGSFAEDCKDAGTLEDAPLRPPGSAFTLPQQPGCRIEHLLCRGRCCRPAQAPFVIVGFTAGHRGEGTPPPLLPYAATALVRWWDERMSVGVESTLTMDYVFEPSGNKPPSGELEL
ncbi:hypothetical protein EV421DRAFT_1733317 [Armillaria borealis]|uniref:Uncharacterized protein n=1 Tax=Armillaria borealis TaxID=47425 RepID=A0AA39JSM0_9AGAR|nr:hypothetical protein EV421DRAFT_1733317 [Armillaria borealis]